MSILALALGIGVNVAVFTAYKAFVARTLDGRDPDTLVNLSRRLQSGATNAIFSYPDYEAFRDGLAIVQRRIAFSIEQQLTLTDAGGAVSEPECAERIADWQTGLLHPSASNREIASAFVVSENYFSVLGVGPARGRAFDAMSASELVTSPSVLISENYWQRRFAGDPSDVGEEHSPERCPFTIVGITPSTSRDGIRRAQLLVAAQSLSADTPAHYRLRDREDLCCRVFGRLAPGVSRGEAQSEATVLASRLRALHEPNSELRKDLSAVISPGSPLPRSQASLKLTIVLIMAAAGLVLVIACANAAGLQLARGAARQQELGMRLALGASGSRLVRQLMIESALVGALAGSVALPVTWAMLRVAVTKLAEQLLPVEVTLILDVSPDISVFAYVLAISMLAGILFGLAPALASSRAALFSITRGTGTSLARGRLRHGLIAAQVAVSLTLMIAGGLLVRSASQALTMETGYNAERVVSVSLQFPETAAYTTEYKGSLVRDLRSRVTALPGVSAVTSARAPSDNGGRRAAVSLNRDAPSPANMRATLYHTWVQPSYFETMGIPLSRGRGFRAHAAQADHDAILSESAAHRLWSGQNPSARACGSALMANSTIKANCCPTVRPGRSSGWPATHGVSRSMAATLSRYTSHYQATGSRIIRCSFARTQTRD